MSFAKRALMLPKRSAERRRIESFIGGLSDESIEERRREREESGEGFQLGKAEDSDVESFGSCVGGVE